MPHSRLAAGGSRSDRDAVCRVVPRKREVPPASQPPAGQARSYGRLHVRCCPGHFRRCVVETVRLLGVRAPGSVTPRPDRARPPQCGTDTLGQGIGRQTWTTRSSSSPAATPALFPVKVTYDNAAAIANRGPGMRQYCTSKLCNIYCAYEMSDTAGRTGGLLVLGLGRNRADPGIRRLQQRFSGDLLEGRQSEKVTGDRQTEDAADHQRGPERGVVPFE
jgi:hypothetical protein